jgi:Lrp/AsnC family leucine-responsive transcriptional regulator
MAELARRVKVSVPTARDRVRRLQDRGVIRGYRLDVDPAA